MVGNFMPLNYFRNQKVKSKLFNQHPHELKKQRGMTLLEIIIVLGIIGTIAAGVVVLAQRAFDGRAISEVVTNTNTARIATKDAYQRTGYYPQSTKEALKYTADDITETKNSDIISRLVQLNKLSIDEARNSISNDFLNIGGALTASGQEKAKGFFIEVNGLSQDQCRSIIAQVGNQWDYVEVDTSAAGSYSKDGTLVDLSKPVVVAEDGKPAPQTGIMRSLAPNGRTNLGAEVVAGMCTDGVSNSVILGSR